MLGPFGMPGYGIRLARFGGNKGGGETKIGGDGWSGKPPSLARFRDRPLMGGDAPVITAARGGGPSVCDCCSRWGPVDRFARTPILSGCVPGASRPSTHRRHDHRAQSRLPWGSVRFEQSWSKTPDPTREPIRVVRSHCTQSATEGPRLSGYPGSLKSGYPICVHRLSLRPRASAGIHRSPRHARRPSEGAGRRRR